MKPILESNSVISLKELVKRLGINPNMNHKNGLLEAITSYLDDTRAISERKSPLDKLIISELRTKNMEQLRDEASGFSIPGYQTMDRTKLRDALVKRKRKGRIEAEDFEKM